jgi:hypothetical protein
MRFFAVNGGGVNNNIIVNIKDGAEVIFNGTPDLYLIVKHKKAIKVKHPVTYVKGVCIM